MYARDIMTRSVVSVPPTASVVQTARILTRRKFTALPVVDETGGLLGDRHPGRSHQQSVAGRINARRG